ncbi:MAG: 1-acyl-sn-glycerol-3-phosphate acyltransferase [Paludibacteraceae bacterium]|nr:1-acyl-sn-glycerol-3-phosphate acyltransferase [Paludibacteraceae bacterium]
MNIRYDDLIVEKGVYVPEIGKTYPEQGPDKSQLKPVYIDNIVFDENYPYLDDSFRFKLNNWVGYYLFLYPIVFAVNKIKNGLRIEGRENLKKWKKALNKKGAITISNHCNRLDAPAVLNAVWGNRHTRIPMYAPNFNTKDHWYMWAVGGIPIPDTGFDAMKKFYEAFDEFNRRGWWFHIFPEAARWDGYKPLRPFQRGAFTMAYKYDKPLLPCVINYRPRTGIYRLFGSQDQPLLTVKIGEPVFPDRTKSRKQEVERMREECHLQMQRMAGIVRNTWPVVPESETNLRSETI